MMKTQSISYIPQNKETYQIKLMDQCPVWPRKAMVESLNYLRGLSYEKKLTYLQKLIDAELTIVNRVAAPLINKALNLNLESSQDCAQFKLLSVRIEDFLSKYSDDVKATVSRYQEYAQTKIQIDKVYSIAGNSFYNTTHNLPESHNLKTLETIPNDDYGVVIRRSAL